MSERRKTCLAVHRVVLALSFLFICASGFSQSNLYLHDGKDYKVTYWTTDDGLPANTLVKLYQDKDGFLWIGSFDGLVRFDGSSFVTYNKANTANLSSNHARVLRGDDEGNLWMGTGNGLVLFRGGKFTRMADESHVFFIESMHYDQKGEKIWIGTRDAGVHVYDIEAKTYKQVEGITTKDIINALIADAAGNIWAGAEKTGVAKYENGQWKHFDAKDGLATNEVNALLADSLGNLYVGTTSGLYVRKGEGKFELVSRLGDLRINEVKKDRAGNLWVLTVQGVYVQSPKGDWIVIDRADGLSNNDARDIYFDEEGNIWIATYRGGLNQLRETKFVTYGSENGLDVEATGALRQIGDNKLLVGDTEGNLYAIEGGNVSPFKTKTKLTQRIYYIFKDRDQHLWIASYDGLLLITRTGQERLFTVRDGLPTNQLRVIRQDSRGDFWIGTRSGGLVRMEFREYPMRPTFSQFKFDELNNINSTFIMSVDEDRKGNLLVGSNTGGLNVISPDGSIKSYGRPEGLVSNIVFNAHADDENVIWLATSDGLARLENGKFFNYTRNEGLPQESLYDVVGDDLGYLWMPMAKGIIRVQKKQLNDFKAGKSKTIEWKVYDKNGDLKHSECTGGTHMIKDSEGTLWFAMLGGVVKVDPASITVNMKVPKVFIEKMVVDDEARSLDERVIIPAGARRILFNYTAVSLRYPASARYRYRLENFDEDWIDADQSREAVYTSLPDGDYSFRVIASNNDGVWNSTGASIPVVVRPHYYQTWWFYSLAGLGLVLLVFTYTRLRTRSIQQRSAVLEAKIEERTSTIAQQRDELITLNKELRLSQAEVMEQRDALANKNEEIETMNTNLERLVADRTRVLEEQNKRLQEYAYINAHKLRAPLASILGLINLLKIDVQTEEERQDLEHLHRAAAELDTVVRAINRMLEKEMGSESVGEKDGEDTSRNA